MGSGFRTFATSEVLTGSNVQNYLMEQSVMSFASTGARDTQITAPETGMVAYVGSGDSSEGLYHYTSGSAWRKGPGWNAPWGHVVSVATGAGTATVFELIQSSCASTTFVANRLYRWTVSASYVGTIGGDLFQAILRQTSTAGTARAQTNFTIHPTSAKGSFSVSAFFSPGAVTFTPVVTIARISGTGTANLDVACYQIIEDIGPSGAPA